MQSIRKLLLGTAALVGLWIGWGAYVTRTTEHVPTETLDRFDDVEIRRYPRTVRAETTAPDAATAFRRLFRYISGENTRREDVAMTAPVTVRGTSIPMTTPVRTGSDGDDVTMAFYLPRTYTGESDRDADHRWESRATECNDGNRDAATLEFSEIDLFVASVEQQQHRTDRSQ